MSRIGKQPVEIPSGVTVTLDGQHFSAKGPKGELELEVRKPIALAWGPDDGKTLVVTRPDDQSRNRALHGLTRSLVANIVEGVSQGFSKTLEIVGVGYRVQAQGTGLRLSLGFSHPIEYPAPKGINFEVPNQTTIVVRGADKQQVGHTAAVIRAFRPPEPYKGKGVRYQGEHVRRKAGKTAAS
ncbi:MAG: 50S ribosomal protein L6 [Gemmatimonadetes bacterium]|nr:50S ribosomal protein L6 [Gemmatimonadota bacterium]MYA63692.1 50S ribosomal protein L6 [Gemmatimonadota bacterium]MYB99329.1 50S ribosomal protein L6 [Gemmatimonadota bacterium]MYH52370.1 50S ribosomal protein L6 [Gemmatimonadota bacterium]MYI45716.1 50S ribosomal protein L6 [Gemmatimonadota bacterium]